MSSDVALEALLDALPLGVVAFDDAGRIRFLNGAARTLLRAPEDTTERAIAMDTLLCLDPTDASIPEVAYGPAESTPRLCVRLEELPGVLAGLRAVIVRPYASPNDVLGPHVAMLGHELRNPLAPLRLAARHLRESGAEPATACIAIERNVEQLARIVDDVLDTQQAAQGQIRLELAPTPLADSVADALSSCSPQFEDLQHSVSVDLEDLEGVVVNADRTRLVQALSNLLSNAATHTPRGGIVQIRGWIEDTTAHVSITDNGPGLSATSLETIFDIFARSVPPTQPASGGLGLGLGLSRHIIELHGGEVTAASPGLGLGSTFSVTLPNTSVLESLEPSAALPSAASAPLAILIVDDNEDAAAMLALVLESQGATCTVEHTGLAALKAAGAEQFDLAILDIGLPDIDGFEVARRAQTLKTRPIRVVALSGYGQQSDRDAAQAAGFDAYYVKPLQSDALTNLLCPA